MLFFIRFTFKWFKRGVKWSLFAGAAAFIGVLCVLGYAITQGPPSLMTEQNTVYYSQDEAIIGEDHGAEERYWTNIEDMPKSIKEATIAIEDRRFYDHFGFDVRRIASAALTDLKHMEMVEGASTITQQYARNLYLSHDKTWKRKIQEALYALRLEIFYNKDEILEGYLNTIYYGHGAYGIEAASRYFFNKPAEELTLTESAMLAGIPKGPSYYSPLANEERAKSRQSLILSEMEKSGFITDSEKTEAVTASLTYSDPDKQTDKDVAPYFQDQVLTEAARILDVEREAVQTGGYHIYTTLVEEHQTILEEKIAAAMPSEEDAQVASAVMDSESGSITALVGGRDYSESSYNRVTQARRHVGSTIKPFLYYAALEEGYSPVTMIKSEDKAFKWNGEENGYDPKNYNHKYAEKPITMAQALAVSDNIYAVSTHMDIGPKNLVNTLETFGISTSAEAVPSLALGAVNISLYEMLEAYGKLVHGSESLRGHTIQKITDRHGNVLYEYKPVFNEEDPIDPDRAFTVTHMMTGMFDSVLSADYAPVTGSSILGKLTRMYGGKSGTTDADSWMIGFSPEYLSAVWIGHDKGQPLTDFNEKRYAKTIWADTMEAIHEPLPQAAFIPTPGVKGVYIDPETGFRAGPNCPQERLMYMPKKDIPKTVCGSDENRDIEDLEDEFRDDPWFKGVVDWIF
ncbi:PBP1A family penicillin-binding protein [Halobacillus litoralis]|uniref:transglycosylase domain-containing protein n=1 Tax=Halobacillus litoralis TaxID=45668 RepID=UPI001CD43577|nr:PBP1A family penicillin-binding protein [Halobacillus litoralis]MCA0971066.1 PBP1A family penicillin-binding protein [Halobacillus litoralis]